MEFALDQKLREDIHIALDRAISSLAEGTVWTVGANGIRVMVHPDPEKTRRPLVSVSISARNHVTGYSK